MPSLPPTAPNRLREQPIWEDPEQVLREENLRQVPPECRVPFHACARQAQLHEWIERLTEARSRARHRAVGATLRKLEAGPGYCFHSFGPESWLTLIEQVVAEGARHPAVALPLLKQLQVPRPEGTDSDREARMDRMAAEMLLPEADLVRNLISTQPFERTGRDRELLRYLPVARLSESVLYAPWRLKPTDRDIAVTLIAGRAGLTGNELLAAHRGEIDRPALATLAALADSALAPWLQHIA